jgi:methionyl aminopeptidase
MRHGGKILNQCIKEVQRNVNEGVSTYKLDKIARSFCKKNNVIPAFLGYRNYPSTMCIGVNDVVVHGIPSKEEILESGDIVSLDMGIIYKDLYVDKAVTVGVGKITEQASQLIKTTSQCLFDALSKAVGGNTIGDIGFAIESRSISKGFSVVKQMVGHGIGRSLHEDPQIPGYGVPGEGKVLQSGMTLAIEAIINQGTDEIVFLDDGWTTKTKDGSLSALFEDTVLVLDHSYEVLTG